MLSVAKNLSHLTYTFLAEVEQGKLFLIVQFSSIKMSHFSLFRVHFLHFLLILLFKWPLNINKVYLKTRRLYYALQRKYYIRYASLAATAAKSLQSCLTLRPHGLQPTRLPHPWDSPGKNTGVGCHCLLQCMKVKSESDVTQSCPTQRPHGLQPTRLLGPWDFPGKSTGVGCHCLLRCMIYIL